MCGKNCCCIFTVKTGTLMLLWITVIFWGILETEVIREIFLSWISPSSGETLKPEQKEQESPSSSSQTTDDGSRSGVLSTAFCFYGIILAMAISGLYAIGKKKPSLLIPYFVYRIFWAFSVCVFSIPLFIIESFLSEAVGPLDVIQEFLTGVLGNVSLLKHLGVVLVDTIRFAQGAIMFAILMQILIMVLEIHFTTVVYKYYRQLENEKEKEKNSIPSAAWSAANEAGVRIS